MKRLVCLFLLTWLILAGCLSKQPTPVEPGDPPTPGPDSLTVLEIVESDPRLEQLSEALTPELKSILGDPDYNLTLFAPVNEAFGQARFDEYELDTPFPAEQTLTNVLYFHISPGITRFEDIMADIESEGVAEVFSVVEDYFYIYVDEEFEEQEYGVVLDPGYFSDEERYAATQIYPVLFEDVDIEADNGVVHLIDDLLLTPTISEMAFVGLSNGQAEFVAALRDLDVFDEMLENGPFTVFVPSFEAFQQQYTEAQIAYLLTNPEALQRVVDHHILAGEQVFTGALTDGMRLRTRAGETLAVVVNGESTTIGGYPLTTVEIEGERYAAYDTLWRNGVAHSIDGLLVPSDVVLP
jgi:transforming growth factor-beta-induced protein